MPRIQAAFGESPLGHLGFEASPCKSDLLGDLVLHRPEVEGTGLQGLVLEFIRDGLREMLFVLISSCSSGVGTWESL
jgi:hypothetical protein